MANGRSLTFEELEALGGGTKIVVTLAGRGGARQTVVGELNVDWPANESPRLELWAGAVGEVFVATLNPGDGFDEDFVALAEGGQA